MLKKILAGVVVILLMLGIVYRELISYGYMQAKGQLHILFNTRPVAEVLRDPALPDSLKQRLKLIGEIKQFAVDSLGLDSSGSYTDYYDQGGKPILWVLTACEPFRMVPKEWRFPVIGTFAYKGFFDTTRAHTEEKLLKASGYDTRINEVSAWSTLGFFKDPVLSSMLYRSEGSLANLIIHEMTHGTLFVKDNLELNENLASFVGDYGAVRFMKAKYGQNAPQIEKYEFRNRYSDALSQHIVRGANQLDSLYKSFRPTLTTAQKERLKVAQIQHIVASSDTLLGGLVGQKYPWRGKELPNNAFFIGYLTYHSQQNQFNKEFNEKFKGNFRAYLSYLKTKYPTSF
ncbi:aminopeptidase [Runella slithyformis]|uniref:Aminopeptidase n=1 Tax=Runella slithyformis (strain ATCC 29530 / DSM 19594 / LMG 11500 / NCIMB 11436 / LSU 4) TaxID=761193 RepID=A0A7U3ZQN7_RUNSL|nr:aminopeptidase [Runella slithyformis]AEI51606.1 aminopeptidase [Runella slithyformis DSM 19594]